MSLYARADAASPGAQKQGHEHDSVTTVDGGHIAAVLR